MLTIIGIIIVIKYDYTFIIIGILMIIKCDYNIYNYRNYNDHKMWLYIFSILDFSKDEYTVFVFKLMVIEYYNK